MQYILLHKINDVVATSQSFFYQKECTYFRGKLTPIEIQYNILAY